LEGKGKREEGSGKREQGSGNWEEGNRTGKRDQAWVAVDASIAFRCLAIVITLVFTLLA
jgi:hypothetical protein